MLYPMHVSPGAAGHGHEVCTVCAGCQGHDAVQHLAGIHTIATDLAAALGADPGVAPPSPPSPAAAAVPSVAERRAHGAAYGMVRLTYA